MLEDYVNLPFVYSLCFWNFFSKPVEIRLGCIFASLQYIAKIIIFCKLQLYQESTDIFLSMSKETKADKNKQNFYFIWDNHLIFLAITKASKIFTLGRKNKYFMSLVKKAVAEQICTRVWSTGKALHCAECCCRNHKHPTMDCTLHISMAIIRRASFPGGSRLTFIFLKCILKPLPTM